MGTYTYGTPVGFKPREEEEERLSYGEPVALRREEAEQPRGGIMGWLFNRPTEEEGAALREYHAPEAAAQRARMPTSTAPGGGTLGLPHPDELEPTTLREMRRRTQAMVDQSWEGFEQDPAWDLIRKNFENAPDRFIMQAAGGLRSGEPVSASVLMRNAREDSRWGGAPTSNDPKGSRRNYEIADAWIEAGAFEVPEGMDRVDALVEFLGTPEGQAHADQEAQSTPLAMKATEWWDDAAQEMQANLPQVRPRSAKYYAAGILEATINMGPAVAMTLATRNPNIGAVIMGGQVYGESYGHMRDRGASHEQAQQAALFFAAAETLTERLPLGVLTRNNFRGMKRILAAAGAEGIQEPLTEALQMGYEYGILNNDEALDDAFMKLVDAGIIGFGAGAGMGMMAAASDQLTTPAGQDFIAEEEELGKIAEHMEERREIRTESQGLEEQLIPLQTAIEDPTQLDDAQIDQLADDGMVTRADDGRVQVLPRARRERNRREQQLETLRGEEALVKEGATREEAPVIYETIAARQRVDEAEAETTLEATLPQQAWGNYKKGRFTWNNQEIAIETPRGEWRRGPGWQQQVNSGYGYFVGKPGADDGAVLTQPRELTGTLNERLDQAVDEQEAMPSGPVKDAAFRVTSPAWSSDGAPQALITLVENGRADLAELLVERAQARADNMDTTPNVEKTSPRYSEIQAELERLKQEAQDEADQLANLLRLRTEEAADPYVNVPTEDTGRRRPTEGVDVYVGPDVNFQIPYIVNQKNEDGSFDEHKVMIGYRSMAEAEAAYKADFAPAREDPDIDIVAFSPGQLDTWLEQSEHTQPVSREEAEGYDLVPMMHVEDDTQPTVERYPISEDRPAGAPSGVETLADVNAQIDDVVFALEDSKAEDWILYEDLGAAVRDVTLGDAASMHKVVKALAALSQAVGVTGDTSAFVEAAYELAKNNFSPMVGRYEDSMTRRVNTLFDAEEVTTDLPDVDENLVNSYRSLYDSTFNTTKYPEASTIDRGGVMSGAENAYAKNILQDAVNRYNARNGTDWLPRHAEAALKKGVFSESPGVTDVAQEVSRNSKLSAKEKAIEQRLVDKIAEHGVEGMERLYAELSDSEGGIILSVDTARELSDDYLADRTQSNAIQSPASWLIRQFYERRLRQPTPKGKLPTVLFSAGGTGSGKTSSLKKVADIRGYEIIYDTNLAKPESAIRKIDQAIAAGRDVGIVYVWRDPVEAFANGMLPRAERQRQKHGTGRTVPLQVHMRTHIDGYQTIRQLTDHYADNPKVEITVLDNSNGKGNAAVLGSIGDLTPTNLGYNSLEGQLNATLKEQLDDGRISQATYDGVTTGTEVGADVEEEGLGPRAGRQPEPQRPEQRADKLKLLRGIATEFVARFPNSPDIVIAPTVDSFPEEIRDRVKGNAPKNITGLFVPSREGAKMYLVAENLTGPRHALSTMLHEAVGHYGLRSILGAEYDSTMDKIFKSHNAAVRRAARRNSILLTNPVNRRLAAEEFVAYRAQQVLMSGKLPKGSWFLDMVDAVKVAVARMRGISFSDTEVIRLIMKARKFTSTPAGLAHGAARNMRPPVLGYRAWQAINERRVSNSGPAETYVNELKAQRRAGNLDEEMAGEMIEWVVEQPGTVDKYELLKKLQQIGNSQAMFHVEIDGRRDAILNGDNMDAPFDIEEGSKKSRYWNYMVFKAQDKFIDLLNVQKSIEQQRGAQLPDDIDAYLQEELFHGRIKHAVDEFHKNYIKPLIVEIRDSDYTWDEVEWYLYARHAPEANAQLYKINRATSKARRELTKQVAEAEEVYKDRPQPRKRAIASAQAEFDAHVKERLKKDPGLKELSGMSNAEAEDIMAVLGEKAEISQLEEIAALVDAMTAESRRVKVEEGLETQETIDAWEKTYKHYVPLKGFQDGPGNTTFFPKKGKGYDTGGALQKRRMGRRTKAANILANIVASHQTTMVLAEKAKVGRSLLEMVKANPNPKIWSVDTLPATRSIDKTTGLVVTQRDPLHRLRDNVVRVKVEGKDHIVTFNENYEPGLRIARSMKNLSSQEMNWMFNSLLQLNRVLSAVNTSFNPEFILSNLVRDLQTAAINLNATDSQNVKTKIMKDVFKAHRGIRRYLDLPSFKDQEAADFWRAEFDEYRALGGQVGWLDNYKDVQDLEQALYREMHQRDAGLISWHTLGRMGRYIEMENQAIENAVRLSAFHHSKQYMSPERAASLAKNLTVNFNRKGDVGTQMNALYLFYNASIQGASIMWKSAKSPRARKVMYGIIAFAAAMNIINRMIAGDDDDGENRYDKLDFYVKERNMIIMLPERWQSEDPESFEDYFITVPLPYGYNMLYMLGDKIGSGIDYYGIGNKRELDPMQGAFEIVATALGSFNPIGTGPTPLQTIAFTFLQPLVQTSENTAWHGGPVYPEPNSFDPAPPPESQWAYRSTPEHTKALAEFLNRLGGGTDVRPATVEFMDISPETIQLWEDFLTGGAGRFVTNLVELGVMAKEGEIETRNVPFLRRLVGKTDERQVQNRFYEHREHILYAEAERDSAREGLLGLTGADRATAQERLEAVENTYAVELRMIPAMESANNYIREQNIRRRGLEEKSGWTEERIETTVETIEERKVIRMNRLNTLYQNLLRDELTSRAEESIFPLIKADTRREIVANFRNEGMPAVAELIESLPAQVPSAAQQGLQEAIE